MGANGEKSRTQQVADALSLSRVTVWKVLNDRPGVAPKTAQRVRAMLETLEGGSRDGAAGAAAALPGVRNITLVSSRANTSVFWMRIVDQIASDLNGSQIGFRYLPVDTMGVSPADLREMLRPDRTDGLLVLNVYDEPLLSLLASAGLPKVFLDTIPGYTAADLRGDLLLLEGERTVAAITADLIARGRRRIGFIGDIRYAQTNLLRWKGYAGAMGQAGLAVEDRLCLTHAMDKDGYREEIGAFLDGLEELPDAFVCASDFVAFLVLRLLDGRCRIPGDLLLSGYDDSGEFLLDRYGVTTVRVQNALLGRRMVHQLLYRIGNPQADPEEIQVLPRIIFRA